MEIYQKRLSQVQEKINDRDLEALLIPPSTNLRYLTGYTALPDERLLLLVIPAEGEPFFVAPELYQAHIEKTPIKEVVYWKDEDQPIQLFSDEMEKRELSTGQVAVESELPALFLLPIQQTLPNLELKLEGEIFSELRMIKDRKETELIGKAGALTDQVLSKVINGTNWVGKTERELATALEFELKNFGMGGLSFEPIIATGPNGASPHHKTGDTVIKENQAVIVDFGGIYQGYCSDMSRTFYFGDPDDKFKEVYQIVKEAQQLAVDNVKPGMTAEEVDKLARDYIEEKGYGEYFIHRTGHGLGMDCHETPYIVKGNDIELEPGMVFSIEPGIYIPGEFGVRIEDIVVVTENGCQAFNNYPKRL